MPASTATVPFTYRHSQQPLKLLELPPDLADALDSPQPPRLYLKSPAPAPAPVSGDASGSSKSKPLFVNLCTSDRTYFVRQVHSSNSIIVAGPSQSSERGGSIGGGNGGENGNTDWRESTSLSALALCRATLELSGPPADFSAFAFLRQALQVYTTGDISARSGGGAGIDNSGMDMDSDAERRIAATIAHVLVDIPLSPVECMSAWREACAFVGPAPAEEARDSQDSPALVCYRPSAEAALAAWSRVMDGALVRGLKIAKPQARIPMAELLAGAREMDSGDGDGDEEIPRGLVEAVVRHVSICEKEGYEYKNGSWVIGSPLQWITFDRLSAVRWTGQTLLESTAPAPTLATSTNEFVSAWQDLLPEAWRGDAVLGAFKCYQHPRGDTAHICFKEGK